MKGLPETIDRLIALDLHGEGILDGLIDPLYRAARAQSPGPLAWEAGRHLREAAQSGKPIYIATGHVHPLALPVGETDGPPGAAALARALVMSTRAPVILLCEPVVRNTLVHTCIAAGLVVREDVSSLPMPRSVAVLPFPIDPDEARHVSKAMAKDAAAIVTIEKVGRATDGGYYTGLGTDVADHLSKIDLLVDAIREAGGLTIGIGDLGSEIGMGRIIDTVVNLIPRGPKIACTVVTDVLVVAGTSNWGAYGITAALAGLERNPALVPTGELERDMIVECCRAGGADSHSTGPTNEVDGASWQTHATFAQLMHDLVKLNVNTLISERLRFEITAT
ncbi:hypothetical protein ANRL1_01513 [Anaerolineae bacterium]|nr:hypothetical protein ANRL1_01513 [Anaerolineae bacterium]